MELSERAEEILETLWIKSEEEKKDAVPLSELPIAADVSIGARYAAPASSEVEAPLNELISAKCVTVENGAVTLTDVGRPLAKDVVRRHRLAERLLADVLDAWNETNHEKACKFEHLLDRGLDDSICSLLGHPKVCPHGKPIPPGKCCEEMRAASSRLVSPLSHLVEGQKGKVAYIYAPKLAQLQKLTAMGILPGASISVLQSFPAHVFQVGQTQFAVDREIADAIYVRLTEAEAIGRQNEPTPDKRRGFVWGRGRRREEPIVTRKG